MQTEPLYFGRNGTKVTINVQNGKVYPVPTGVSKKGLPEACRELSGRPMSESTVVAMLKDLL